LFLLVPAPVHDHDHEHEHGDGPGQHRHLPEWRPDAAIGVKVRELVALGVSGGIVPCPSALVVLLTAVSLHRIGFGLLLIVAFSVGLAATLTGIGLLVVWGSRFFDRFPASGRLTRVLPVVSTSLIIVIGVGIAWRAMASGAV
jgi:ABC-type nickel/cobalt efflux system permease component RcnA